MKFETHVEAGPPSSVPSFLAGGGDMGKRMRAFDWAATPLGPPDSWQRSLKTAVRIVLTCRQPMFVWWGEEFINIYNDAYTPILGKKHPDALGKPAAEVWSEIWSEVGPRAESAFLNNEGTFDEDLLLIMQRHGYPEETYYTFSYSPVPDDSGATGGMICACTEETRRKIGDRRLDLLRILATSCNDAKTVPQLCLNSCESMATNFEDLPFALIYLQAPQQCEYQLAGTSGMAAGHSAAPETIVPEDESSPLPLAQVIRENREICVVNLSQSFDDLPTGAWERAPDKAVLVPIEFPGQDEAAGVLVAGLNPFRPYDDDYAGFIRLVSGQIAAGIARAQAFEEQKKRAESLAELDRAKTAFFSNVSHEFRTPLTLILGPLAEFREWASEQNVPSDISDLIEAAQRNGHRLLKLVNTLLDFSRIEAGRIDSMFEEMDLAALTADLASTFETAMSRAGLDYTVDCPPLSERVFVDRDMWEKVVLNLVSNAFKYTLNGAVTVSQKIEGGHAVLTVKDSGIGIPDSELPSLFDRFHRVEGSRGRSVEGSGIGLALVKKLVGIHGGTVTVESTEGSGTTFTVRVPLGSNHLDPDRIAGDRQLASTSLGASAYVEEALRWLPDDLEAVERPGTRRTVPSPKDRAMGTRPHILLAEDNADMRTYIERLLVSDYGVTAVGDGAAALEVAHIAKPDLILSDITMPKVDGFQLIREIRKVPETAGIPIILLSGRKGEEARIEGVEAGADDFLTKPFSARELVARVGGALDLARVRREALLREKELLAETSHVLSSITEGFLHFDENFVYTAMNDRAEEIKGMSRSDLIGKSLWDVFPDLKGSVVEVNYRKALDEQKPVRFEVHYDSWNRWFEISAYPSRGGGLDVFFRDTTQRARTDAILEGQKRALERAVHGAPLSRVLEILVRLVEDLSGGRVLASILLMAEDGRRLVNGAAPSLPDAYNQAIDGVEIGPKVGSCGTAAFEGRPVIVSDIENDPLWEGYKDLALEHGLRACWSTPIHSSQGKVLGTFAIYQTEANGPASEDETTVALLKNTAALVIEREQERRQRQEIAESLRDADRKKDEFLATLAHELRNPLAPIRTGLEILKMAAGDPEKSERIRNIMERQTVQMVRLIDDLMDISRITRGKFELQIKRIRLLDVVQDAVEATRPFVEEADHNLSVKYPHENLEIDGDPHRLAQVFANLLNNAAKYTPRSGHIALQYVVDPDSRTVVVSVTDNGDGIAKQAQASVFDMFSQVAGEGKRTNSGLGIGLTLVKSLVEMHAGTVAVHSDGEGQGSRFSVVLPLPAESESESESDSEQGDSASTNPPTEADLDGGGSRVLVVDDKRNAAETQAALFQMEGFDVQIANDGVEAVELFQSFQPDLVVMDIGMPQMDGNEAARRIRALENGGDVYLIALTGWGQDKDREKTADAGFDEHLVKPVDPGTLRDALRKWRRRRLSAAAD